MWLWWLGILCDGHPFTSDPGIILVTSPPWLENTHGVFYSDPGQRVFCPPRHTKISKTKVRKVNEVTIRHPKRILYQKSR